MKVVTDLPPGTASLVMGWMVVALCVLSMLGYRLRLGHHEHTSSRGALNAVAAARIARLDRWGATLTGVLVAYGTLILGYLAYHSLDRIAQFFLRLLSLV